MSDTPAFTDYLACFGDFKIKFQRDHEGNVADIIQAWIYSPMRLTNVECFYSLQLILTALNSDFPELISNCKDIKNL